MLVAREEPPQSQAEHIQPMADQVVITETMTRQYQPLAEPHQAAIRTLMAQQVPL